MVGEEEGAGGGLRADGAQQRLGARRIEVVEEALQDLFVCWMGGWGCGLR